MRYLVVTGDDLGLSPGVNRGIVEAHERGILTSASLIVDLWWSESAAAMARETPGLSIGLHVNVPRGDANGERAIEDQLADQLRRFLDLMGTPPAHIDSHHNDHEHPELLPRFAAFAADCGVALRGHSPIRSVTSFYGRWDDVSHPEQISVEGLAKILETRMGAGVSELSCHPGHVDPELRSSYTAEREIELATLCDPRVPEILQDLEIELVRSADALRAAVSR